MMTLVQLLLLHHRPNMVPSDDDDSGPAPPPPPRSGSSSFMERQRRRWTWGDGGGCVGGDGGGGAGGGGETGTLVLAAAGRAAPGAPLLSPCVDTMSVVRGGGGERIHLFIDRWGECERCTCAYDGCWRPQQWFFGVIFRMRETMGPLEIV
jgi:hypothetical protein